jgi:chemotaxis protein histidine kinase CheA
MASWVIIVLAAMSTAAGVIVLALVLPQLVRRVVDTGLHPEPNLWRLPNLVSGRFGNAWRGLRVVSKGGQRRGRTPHAPPARRRNETVTSPGRRIDERPVSVREEPLPPGPVIEEPPVQVPAAVGEPRVPQRRSVEVKQPRQSRFERHERRGEEEAERSPQSAGSVEGDSATYRHVGEEVTAVLTAAEQAAARIRETAVRAAEQTTLAAEEKAAATLADAEARRREADSYSGDTHTAADAYADETRRRADETAAKRLAEGEEQARLIRVEAEQKASNLIAEAVRRRDTLAESTKGLEDRVDSMLTTLRGVSSELEELLPARRQTVAHEPGPPDETLDEALEPSRLS